MQRFKPNLIEEYLSQLNADMCYTLFVTKAHKKTIDKFEVEPFFGTKCVHDVPSQDYLNAMKASSTNRGEFLYWPPPNDFVPPEVPKMMEKEERTQSQSIK